MFERLQGGRVNPLRLYCVHLLGSGGSVTLRKGAELEPLLCYNFKDKLNTFKLPF